MAELSEEQLRVRGYIQAQAAKLPLAAIIEKVRADSAVLAEAAVAAESIDHTKRPDADNWSVNDVLSHLAETCARLNGQILAAWERGETGDPLEDALRATEVVRRPLEWWETIRSERETLFTQLAEATGDEHLDVRWNHPFFGDLNWREWVLFFRLHDGDHGRQVAGIVAALQ